MEPLRTDLSSPLPSIAVPVPIYGGGVGCVVFRLKRKSETIRNLHLREAVDSPRCLLYNVEVKRTRIAEDLVNLSLSPSLFSAEGCGGKEDRWGGRRDERREGTSASNGRPFPRALSPAPAPPWVWRRNISNLCVTSNSLHFRNSPTV